MNTKMVAPLEEVSFNRDALGISAKKDWHDSAVFASAGASMPQQEIHGAIPEMPCGDGGGARSLQSQLHSFSRVMRYVLLEYSDACATMGSGQERAIANFDRSEYEISDRFRLIAERLGS